MEHWKGHGISLFTVYMMVIATAIGAQSDMDIGFIIDGSGSIQDGNPQNNSYNKWSLMLTFISDLINQLPRTGTQVGAVVFGNSAKVAMKLNEFQNLTHAAQRILGLLHPDENTNTSGGLYIARTELFNINNGDRPDIPNLAIVITDGFSTYDSNKTIPYAEELHDEGIRVISIGITKNIMEEEVEAISSYPHEKDSDYFLVTTFFAMGGLLSPLLSSIYRNSTINGSTTSLPATSGNTNSMLYSSSSSTNTLGTIANIEPTVKVSEDEGGLRAYVTAGIVLFVLMFVAFIIVGAYVLREKRLNSKMMDNGEESGSPSSDATMERTRDGIPSSHSYQGLSFPESLTFKEWLMVNHIPNSVFKKLKKHSITTVEGLKLLTEADFKDLKLNVGERSQLRAIIETLN